MGQLTNGKNSLETVTYGLRKFPTNGRMVFHSYPQINNIYSKIKDLTTVENCGILKSFDKNFLFRHTAPPIPDNLQTVF